MSEHEPTMTESEGKLLYLYENKKHSAKVDKIIKADRVMIAKLEELVLAREHQLSMLKVYRDLQQVRDSLRHHNKSIPRKMENTSSESDCRARFEALAKLHVYQDSVYKDDTGRKVVLPGCGSVDAKLVAAAEAQLEFVTENLAKINIAGKVGKLLEQSVEVAEKSSQDKN